MNDNAQQDCILDLIFWIQKTVSSQVLFLVFPRSANDHWAKRFSLDSAKPMRQDLL
jgi:hypothetical protein